MSERREFCIEDCCEDPSNPGFPLPTWGHGERCEAHTRQWTRNGKCTPIKPKLSASERFEEAVIRMADHADDDRVYDSARRTAWEIAKAEGMKNLTDADIDRLAREVRGKRIKRAMARAKAEGKHVGRPPKSVDMQKLARLVERGRTPEQMAPVLKVSERTIWRLLSKGILLAPPATPA